MRSPLRIWCRGRQGAQALTEFALIAPVLFLLFFGVIDFGRAIYVQATLNQGANEGARVAVRGEPPTYDPASDVDVLNAVKTHTQAVQLGNPCPNGPIPTSFSTLAANQGWVFITEAPAPTSYESSPPVNAPGMGSANPNTSPPQVAPTFAANCNPVNKGARNYPANNPLQVTVYYNFVPLTPLISNLMAGHIILEAHAIYRTEY